MAERTVPTPTADAASAQEPTRSEEVYVAPPADIYEDDQGLVVLVDVPGVEPGALDVRVDRGVLTIQGRAAHAAPGDAVYREYELTGFFRQFQLPEEVDQARIEAELKNGVLTLRLPRAPQAQPRRIAVRAA
ncbi:MAG TPA: Hsp20/alpha crystallin family protein [Chloroflexota bacterium]|jgi:HSP20 family protein|nr:Hsp20/alpha crystallin family protein [Chloroflexota bacterium]